MYICQRSIITTSFIFLFRCIKVKKKKKVKNLSKWQKQRVNLIVEKEYKSSKSKVYPQHQQENTRGKMERAEDGGRATWGSREPISVSSEVGYITDRWGVRAKPKNTKVIIINNYHYPLLFLVLSLSLSQINILRTSLSGSTLNKAHCEIYN